MCGCSLSVRSSCIVVLVEVSSSSSPEQWASGLRWHLSLWLGRVDWSCRQTYGICWLWWHSLHLFASRFPSSASACRSLCAADAHHLLTSSCSCLLLTPFSRMAPPALLFSPWQLCHSSVTQLPSFPLFERRIKSNLFHLCVPNGASDPFLSPKLLCTTVAL